MSTSLPKTNTPDKDNELVLRINAGEYELFPILIKRYTPLINRTARSFSFKEAEIEDLVQEGNIALFSAVSSFKGEKSSFKTYASNCIRNAMIDLCRKSNAKGTIPDNMFSSIEEVEIKDDNTPEKIFFDNENYRFLTDSIAIELSELEYKVLNAHLEGLSYGEIALKLGVSSKSVDNSLKRVRTKLKNIKRL